MKTSMSINPRSFVDSKSFEKCGKLLDRRNPHELSDNNRADRVRVFTELLQRNEQTPFLKNLVNGNESWFFFKNVKRKNVCVSPGVSPERIPKQSSVRRQCGVCCGTEALVEWTVFQANGKQ
ncbi:histone-lysine N-methyltransferase SETMAR [Trichonephila clavipes]|nr:histone-lysine N-methyltransferase SETMAR [Trichonephila clavipes]